MLCEACGQPLPMHHFPGAHPERQRVFTVKDGKRVHLPPCPPKPRIKLPKREKPQ